MQADTAAALAGLFAAAFGAATLLPFQSEVVFVALQLAAAAPIAWIVVVASVGNTLGAVVNYAMGLAVERFHGSRWFPVTDSQLDRAQRWYAKYGAWTLLLSWAPFGDAFTVIAGMMRLNWLVFLLLVTVAKTGRYVALAWVTAQSAG